MKSTAINLEQINFISGVIDELLQVAHLETVKDARRRAATDTEASAAQEILIALEQQAKTSQAQEAAPTEDQTRRLVDCLDELMNTACTSGNMNHHRHRTEQAINHAGAAMSTLNEIFFLLINPAPADNDLTRLAKDYQELTNCTDQEAQIAAYDYAIMLAMLTKNSAAETHFKAQKAKLLKPKPEQYRITHHSELYYKGDLLSQSDVTVYAQATDLDALWSHYTDAEERGVTAGHTTAERAANQRTYTSDKTGGSWTVSRYTITPAPLEIQPIYQ